MAGQLYYIDGIAADSHGNIYTGEVDTGKRNPEVWAGSSHTRSTDVRCWTRY